MTLNAISITYCWNSGPTGELVAWLIVEMFDNIKCNIDNLYDKCNQFDSTKCNIDNLLLKYY